MKKFIFITFLLSISLLGFFAYQKFKFDDGKLHIIFCSVGEGDGIFIRSPKGIDIMIDSGPDDSVLRCLSSHMPFWDRQIELAFLTHPHSDHLTGFIEVLKRYRVLSFNTEKVSNNTNAYKTLIAGIKSNGIGLRFLTKGDSFILADGVNIKILGPTQEFIQRTSPTGQINESEGFGNLITLTSYGSFKAVFTGDSQVAGFQDAAVNSFPVDVFQIPHHGSKYGLNLEILQEFSPTLAVISVGKNKYGHPTKEVLQDLEDLKINYLRTDQKGDIEIVVDSKGNYTLR